MTVHVLPSDARGWANHGWLQSHHSFSFADFYNPNQMGYRWLRVINEDMVAGGGGFPTHPHKDMEIVTYLISGALEHKDSLGTGSVIHPGDVQRMSAGTGVRHSEFNSSKTDGLHFLQIWIIPDKAGYAPSYEEKNFTAADKQGRLRLVASPGGKDGSVDIHQDASLYAGLFAPGESTTYVLPEGRNAWIHVARGKVTLNGETLSAGDAASVDAAGAQPLAIEGLEAAEVLLFDLG